ncbi:MAG: hypothetical protein ACREQ9_08790, partial [Candidatus Binatia bacterium]
RVQIAAAKQSSAGAARWTRPVWRLNVTHRSRTAPEEVTSMDNGFTPEMGGYAVHPPARRVGR